MNHDEKMRALRKVFDDCIKIMDSKGRDYSGVQNAMSNFEDFGWRGIVVRIGDKWHRIKNLCKKPTVEVKDESIEDTLKDLIGYSALALVMKEKEDCG